MLYIVSAEKIFVNYGIRFNQPKTKAEIKS